MNMTRQALFSGNRTGLVLGSLAVLGALAAAVTYGINAASGVDSADGLSPLLVAGFIGVSMVLALASIAVHIVAHRRLGSGPAFGIDLATSAMLHKDTLGLLTTSTGEHVFSTPALDDIFPGRKGLSGVRAMADELETHAELERLFTEATAGNHTVGDVCLGGLKNNTKNDKCWWRIKAFPAPRGQIAWLFEDISAERHDHEQRRDQAGTVTDFLDNLPVGFFALDDGGRFVYANARFARWVGHRPEHLVKNSLPFERLLAGDEKLPGDGVGSVTFTGINGETFRAYVIRNRRESAVGDSAIRGGTRAVVLRDPGKDDSDDLHHIDHQTGLPDWLFGDAPVGIAILDEHGVIGDCNMALCRFLRSRAEELVGQSIASFVALQDQDEYNGVLSKLAMGTVPAAHIEARFQSDGTAEERAASLFVTRINADGTMVLHVIDETEHRNLELQFTQSQKMQAVGQLAGGVAHDFNNLLTAMIGFSDLLLERHGPDDASFDDIMQIKQNANRATNLVRQLLAFSRKQTLQPVVLDPTEMLGDLSNMLGRTIGERVELMFEHAPDAYLIRADRGQFDQVIINLAVNARDAMPGGGSLTVRTRNEIVDAPIQRGPDVMLPGAYVVISVSDTGTGISRENIDRIFEPFFSTKEVGAGTGLGLSTVYGIIRQSEGFIYVESAMGHGTTFHIYLPASGAEGEVGVQAAARAADKARIEHRSAQGAENPGRDVAADLTGSGVILLVEDEDAVRLFGSRALRNKGYTVLEADNGETALDVLNGTDETIDLIVSDVVMPGMDGHTFVQLVRQELPDIRVILMSGYTEEVFREEISRDTTIHFLAKPFSLKTLAGTVKDVMAD